MITATAKIHGQGNADDALDLLNFFADRLKVYLKNDGIRHDVVQAVFALGGRDLLDVVNRAKALQAFLDSEDGDALLQLYRRAGNIVSAEEKKDGVVYGNDALLDGVGVDADAKVMAFLKSDGVKIADAIFAQNYTDAMNTLANGRGIVDTFFADVKVNDDDTSIRKNRLNILGSLRNTMNEIADFSIVE